MIEAPYSQEAEEAVIGAVLISPNTFYAIRGFLKHDDFYFLRHSYIWQAMERLVDRSEPIDNITLQHELDAIGLLDEIGGPAFITHLIANTPTSVHSEVYGRLVERAAIRRRLMVAADEIKVLATDEQLTTEDVMQQATAKIFSTTAGRDNKKKISIEDAVEEYVKDMLEVWENPNSTLGIPTGHKGIDRYFLGFQPNWFVLVAGRPGSGKSAALWLWALHAMFNGYRVGYWTGEMHYTQLVERACAHLSGVANTLIRGGRLTREQQQQMTEATVKLNKRIHEHKSKMEIFYEAKITPTELRMLVLEEQASKGLDILFVDYLGLMSSGERFSKKYEAVSSISNSLKAIANDCNIPVIVAAQANRECENRIDKRPMLHDLADSDSLGRDADVVFSLYRDDMYNESSETPGMIEMNVIKNRHGGTPTFYGRFDGATSTITEAQLREFRTA